ncbi:putative GTP-binding protein-animal [Histomonas meleagridis]|uniref:putative GTP-binding protein-animal n=1 Tax=Histomonas meleagridis TaxID=135588 RepID=UPI00355AB4B9|nr:putative GTP-binding protein-animal [Histomonas meleagridis]KAH0802756.1 putative GTP-binding protein-animal [Histomonas meleagridis]
MGRHRTARAKEKLIRNPRRKLSGKRNRDLKLKRKRKDFFSKVAERARDHQEYLKKTYPTLFPSPKEMVHVKKLPNQTFLDRVMAAQTSYDSLLKAIENSQCVIEIVDARDPYSFRFLDLEGELSHNGTSLIILINKIDLVPAQEISGWIAFLSKTAPTIATSLEKLPTESAELVKQTITAVAPNATQIAVVGAPGTGKTTLCNLVGQPLLDTDKWQWTNCGNSLALTNSVPWKGRIRELAVDTLERVDGENICNLMGIKMENTPGNLLVSYAHKIGVSKQEVPEKFVEKFTSGEWKWFAKPPIIEEEFNISEMQSHVLGACSGEDVNSFIALGQGAPVSIDIKAVSFQLPEELIQEVENISDLEGEEEEETAEE